MAGGQHAFGTTVAPRLIRGAGVDPDRVHPAGDVGRGRVMRRRMRDRRAGVALVIQELSEHLAHGGTRRLRDVFEQSLVRALGLRSARLRVGQAMATGTAPVVRDHGVLEVPVSSGLAILEVATETGRPFDDWEWQALLAMAGLAALVLEIDRAHGVRPSGRRPSPCGLVGSSAAMQELRERIQRVARRDVPVLVEGESGVGKELVARQIHELSPRARGPFVAVNCAALVETLLEAELFGIEDRTATGVRGRRGKFEVADGGTLFLDEIGDLSLQAQAKLLRVLQERGVERVGGHTIQQVDVRLVAATNRQLVSLVEQGRFRIDLFYRLNCIEILVPPLRERREDIGELIEFFLGRTEPGTGVALAPEALDALKAHDWPGNVRELEWVIERAVTLADGHQIGLDHLPSAVARPHEQIIMPSLRGRHTLRLWSSRYARLMLQQCKDNKREACRVLGISYHTLQAHLRHAERADRAGASDGK